MVLFICGIPASGKSSFGSHLKDNYGYFYIDMENRWPDENLHAIWNTVFSPTRDELNVKKFIDAMTNISKNSVLDLGFPVNEMYFWIVPLLKKYDCPIIWFECEEDIARKRYIARDNRPIEWFNTQMTNIKNNRETIKRAINPIIINVLKNDKSDKTNQELFSELVKLGIIKL